MIFNPVVVGAKKATILFKTTAQGVADGVSRVLDIPVEGKKTAAELLASENLFLVIAGKTAPVAVGWGHIVFHYTLIGGSPTRTYFEKDSSNNGVKARADKNELVFNATADNKIQHYVEDIVSSAYSKYYFQGDYDVVVGLIE